LPLFLSTGYRFPFGHPPYPGLAMKFLKSGNRPTSSGSPWRAVNVYYLSCCSEYANPCGGPPPEFSLPQLFGVRPSSPFPYGFGGPSGDGPTSFSQQQPKHAETLETNSFDDAAARPNSVHRIFDDEFFPPLASSACLYRF